MNCYLCTISLQNNDGTTACFGTLIAASTSDEAIEIAYFRAAEDNPGWTPISGKANTVDPNYLREISDQVLKS